MSKRRAKNRSKKKEQKEPKTLLSRKERRAKTEAKRQLIAAKIEEYLAKMAPLFLKVETDLETFGTANEVSPKIVFDMKGWTYEGDVFINKLIRKKPQEGNLVLQAGQIVVEQYVRGEGIYQRVLEKRSEIAQDEFEKWENRKKLAQKSGQVE